MIGIIVIAHGNLAKELINSAEIIMGEMERTTHIMVYPGCDNAEILEKIEKAIEEVDDGDGVVIFVDMLGGTPSNLSIPFIERKGVEIVTGVNLPMLLLLPEHRKGDLTEFAERLKKIGRESIYIASEFLKERSRTK